MPTHRVVTMEELTQYLHLPEKVVAKQLGICLTSLKKLCRQHGITRWPYRKLKSLDKKIAKAETGSSGGGEDPGLLKARAEELKKEKMAVAFTYGLKDGTEEGSEAGGSEAGFSGTEGPAAGKAAAKPKKAKPAGLVTTKQAASAVLLTNPNTPTPTSQVQAAKGKADWPFGKDSPGIPTPPEEPIAPQETDIFAEAVADVMADDPTLDDENQTLPPQLEWDANDEKHEEVESKEEAGTAEVKFNGTPLKGVLQKDKNGGMKMTLMLPTGLNGLSGGLGASMGGAGPLAGKVIVSDADLRIASALASVSSPREPLWADSAPQMPGKDGKPGEDIGKDAAHPKFDIDEEHHDASFGHELMDSEFFSAMARHNDDGEDTVHLDHDDHHAHEAADQSPSSMDSVPCDNSRGEGPGDPDEHEKLPLGGISAEGWDEETRLWLSPDTPSKKGEPSSAVLTPQGGAPTGAAAVILGGRPASGSQPSSGGTPKGGLEGLDIASVLTA